MAWAQMASGGRWKSTPHLEMLNRAVIRTINRGGRLVVSMPPRHGKSLYCSQYLPSWYLGAFPDRQVIWASYSQNFANLFGRKCRNLIEEFGPNYFGVRLAKDNKSASTFGLSGHDGYMSATGIGGALTGRGAHLLIVDDPIKNDAEAASETIRNNHWDWWQSTAYSRLEPGGAAIVIQTRWHEDDLTGRILENDTEGKWEVLNLPAIAAENDPLGRQPGEALWPERYPVEVLNEIKRTLGSYFWSALYQQTPIPDGAGLFMSEWFGYADRVPLYRPMTAVRYWDKASTEGGGDYSAGVLVIECDGHFYVCDVVRGQWSPMKREQVIRETAEKDHERWGGAVRTLVEQEGGSAGVDSAQATVRGLAGFVAGSERVTGDKVTRARPFSSQVEAGNVSLLPGKWHRDYLNELRAFPNGKHDDQVDASSGAFKEVSKGVFPGGILDHVIKSAEKKAKVEGVHLQQTNNGSVMGSGLRLERRK